MPGSYELFDHTADMGLRVFASRREELIAPAIEALYAAIGELRATPSGDPSIQRLVFEGDDAAALLRECLSELLHLFERERLMAVEVREVEYLDRRLVVVAALAPVDLSRSSLDREVKAITYHELSLAESPSGVVATVIVDI